MLRVGLTGGIGAGKSAVAKRLVRRGATLIDADQLARAVVAAGTEGLAEVVEAFGAGVLGPDGELDRPALGALVFGDDDARRRLEGIIHPRVRARTAELTRAAAPGAVVVNDVPLLVETGLAPSYHLVVTVAADEPVRVRRLTQTRGMTPEQARARIVAQAGEDARRAAADVVLDNNAGLAELDARIETLWRRRLLPYEANLRRGRPSHRSPDPHPGEYDPSWPVQADRLIARIRHHVGASTPVSHIGATAVPGLRADDVIELMLGVRTPAEADEIADRLAAAGLPRRTGEPYDAAAGVPHWAGEPHDGDPGVIWPERLHGSADPGRPAEVHVRVIGSPGWRSALLLRDHLRAVPAARDRYAETCAWDEEAAVAARRWAEETGWQPVP